MKKKTLIVLLIIPFIIGLISFVSVVLLNITVASDISGITWAYNDGTQGFKLDKTGKKPYKLEAEPVFDSESLILAPGNDLIWYVLEGEDVVEIKEGEDGSYYLYTLKEGEAIIVCSNEKGTCLRKLHIVVYENGTVIINPSDGGSGQQIEDLRYYGEFDASDSSRVEMDGIIKEKAKIQLNVEVLGDDITSQNIRVVSHSDNISFNETNKVITIENANETTASLTLASSEKSYYAGTFTFSIVPDGVNIYNYNDLLLTTNFSTNGEISVMQKSLGSLKDVYEGVNEEITPGSNQAAYKWVPNLPLTKKESAKNIELFGNYDAETRDFNFEDEVYETETTYNHKFLDDWNESNPNNQVSTDIKVGIRVQKDFYGNGFNINMNNLCFPSNGTVFKGNNGKLVPGENDLFKGPLSFVTIGNPSLNSTEIIVRAFGQDNAGMMLDGDNITLNGLRIQNIDDNSNKRNYAYIGTVVEVNGVNNTIKNSEILLGKNLVRAFDANNLQLKNSILRRSGEFNLMVGSNDVLTVDEEKEIEVNFAGNNYKAIAKDFLNKENKNGASANAILEQYLGLIESGVSVSKEELYAALKVVQESLNNSNGIVNQDGSINYASTIYVDDCSFDDSGIFSIAFETNFNGPYLYNGLSSTVSSVVGDRFSSPLPDKIGGTSKPVNIVLRGNTKFYDWKNIDDIDVSTLLDENISTALGNADFGDDEEINISIDRFFPIKPILRDMANALGYVYKNDGKDYINTIVAYYGGGKNYSNLTIESGSLNGSIMGQKIEVNLLEKLDNYINIDSVVSGSINTVLSRCVLFAAGFEPFYFYTNGKISNETPYLFDEQPEYLSLKENL